HALHELGDEPHARRIAAAIIAARQQQPIQRTTELARLILKAVQPVNPTWRLRPERNRWTTHPAARTFQALRILVNRELANLELLARVLPMRLSASGGAAIIGFHRAEDPQVKAGFRHGLRAGIYSRISEEPVRASFAERTANPRSRSAKLRWAW